MRTFRKMELIWLTGLASFAAVSAVASAQIGPRKRLPPRAVIHMEGRWMAETGLMERRECRSVSRITSAQVRQHFEHWVEIDGMQYDLGWYVYLNCGRSGTAQIDGKTYTWAVQPEDTMTTSWPDGKMHWYVRRILKEED